MPSSTAFLPHYLLPFGADTHNHNAWRRSASAPNLGYQDYPSFVGAAHHAAALSNLASLSLAPSSMNDRPQNYAWSIRYHNRLFIVLLIVFEISLIAVTVSIVLGIAHANQYDPDHGYSHMAIIIVGVFGFAGAVGSAAVVWLISKGHKERAKLEKRWTAYEEMREQRSRRENERVEVVRTAIREREGSLSQNRSRIRGRVHRPNYGKAKNERQPAYRPLTPEEIRRASRPSTPKSKVSIWTHHLDLGDNSSGSSTASLSRIEKEMERRPSSRAQRSNERLVLETMAHVSRPTTPRLSPRVAASTSDPNLSHAKVRITPLASSSLGVRIRAASSSPSIANKYSILPPLVNKSASTIAPTSPSPSKTHPVHLNHRPQPHHMDTLYSFPSPTNHFPTNISSTCPPTTCSPTLLNSTTSPIFAFASDSDDEIHPFHRSPPTTPPQPHSSPQFHATKLALPTGPPSAPPTSPLPALPFQSPHPRPREYSLSRSPMPQHLTRSPNTDLSPHVINDDTTFGSHENPSLTQSDTNFLAALHRTTPLSITGSETSTIRRLRTARSAERVNRWAEGLDGEGASAELVPQGAVGLGIDDGGGEGASHISVGGNLVGEVGGAGVGGDGDGGANFTSPADSRRKKFGNVVRGFVGGRSGSGRARVWKKRGSGGWSERQ